MSWKRLLMVFALMVFAGNVAGKSIITHTNACYPCKGWCKTHPTDPRCNNAQEFFK